MNNNWKSITSAPTDTPIQVKREKGLPVVALISSKYGNGYPILLDEYGRFVMDGMDDFFTLDVNLWREIENET